MSEDDRPWERSGSLWMRRCAPRAARVLVGRHKKTRGPETSDPRVCVEPREPSEPCEPSEPGSRLKARLEPELEEPGRQDFRRQTPVPSARYAPREGRRLTQD